MRFTPIANSPTSLSTVASVSKTSFTSLIVICCSIYNFTVFKFKTNVFKSKAVILRRCVVSQLYRFNRISNRCSINFTVRNICISPAHLIAGICLMLNEISVSLATSLTLSVLFISSTRFIHSFTHFAVIKVTNLEIEILRKASRLRNRNASCC